MSPWPAERLNSLAVQGWLVLPGRGIWRGPGGVRAGWRAVFFLLLTMLLVACALFLTPRVLARTLAPHGHLTPAFVVLNECLLLFPVIAASAVMCRLEGRGVLSCGLGGPWRLARFVQGALAGLALLGLIIGLIAAGGHAALRWGGLSPAEIIYYALAWGLACLLTGLAEELALRGYLLQTLTRGLGFFPALLLTSLLFGALHISNHGEGEIGVISAAMGGAIMAVSVRGTGTLWWAIGLHSAWDYSENFLGGTPDSGQLCVGALLHMAPVGPARLSGGATGPEGSLITVAVLAIVLVLAWRCFRRPAG